MTSLFTKTNDLQANDLPEAPLPLVSVIIPAYNAARFIERTLHSVLNQSYQNLEILVVDDGSDDETAAIVQALAAVDQRITLLQQRNAGVAAARNLAIDNATGEFIAPLDADDLWHQTNIEKQVQVLMAAEASVGMVYAWSLEVDEVDRTTGGVRVSPYYGNIYPAMLYQNVTGNGSASVIRRGCFETVGGYSSDFRAQQAQGCEDFDIYLRIAERYEVKVVPEMLIGYRQVAGSLSTRADEMTRSRLLALHSIETTFPSVYSRVRRWCISAAQMYAARKHFDAHQDAEAWQALSQALRTDWLVIFTHYTCFTLVMRMVGRSLNPPQTRSPMTAPDSQRSDSSTSSPTNSSTNSSLISRAKSYLLFAFILLFPSWLLRSLRMRWLAVKLCPDRPAPMSLPFWTIHQARLKAQMRANHPICRADFGSAAAAQES
ncbi:MAG: glycosyltransferase family 2 protein [Phormidesmis sp.]